MCGGGGGVGMVRSLQRDGFCSDVLASVCVCERLSSARASVYV